MSKQASLYDANGTAKKAHNTVTFSGKDPELNVSSAYGRKDGISSDDMKRVFGPSSVVDENSALGH
jgi:hypothetical protein